MMRLQSITIACLLLSSSLAAQTTRYVHGGLTTGANDGSTWSDAHRGPGAMQVALSMSASGDRVFVAAGTYKPTAQTDRSASFTLRPGVAIYGGFLGFESNPDERVARDEAPTILTGDLLGNDGTGTFDTSDNSFHVVLAYDADSNSRLDGFIVTAGNANSFPDPPPFSDKGGGLLIYGGATPMVANCTFVDNFARRGGGVYAEESGGTFVECLFDQNFGSGPGVGGGMVLSLTTGVRIERCTFRENRAWSASALSVYRSAQVEITSSLFHGNRSEVSSAVSIDWQSTAEIKLCTITDNFTVDYEAFWAGLIAYAPTTITSSIVWGNIVAGSPPITQAQINNHTLAANSIIQGGLATHSGNTALDPMFVNPVGVFGEPLEADYALLAGSPAIDSGNNADVPAGHDRDSVGARRRFDELSIADTGVGQAPVVDRGAFEFTTSIGDFYCSAVSNSTGVPAEIFAMGSLVASDNDVTLEARYVPANSIGFFITSSIRAEVSSPQLPGVLCLGSPLGRLNAPGQIVSSGPDGRLVVALDLTQHPSPPGTVAVQAGDVWHFQAWFRDVVAGGLSSGFSDGLTLEFE